MLKLNKKLSAGLVLILFGSLLTACSSSTPPATTPTSKIPKAASITENKQNKEFIIAGSGSNIPIMNKLIAAYSKKHPDIKIILPPSIGSGGAVKGIKDDALELGLISRELKDTEKKEGIVAVPYNLVGVILAVHPTVSEENITYQEYVDIMKGTKTKWQNGNDIVVLTREKGDSTTDVLSRIIPNFKAAHETALQKDFWQVIHSDPEMNEALQKTPNAIGYSDTGAMKSQQLALRALKVNGIAPTLANIKKGKYELIKTDSIIYKGTPSKRAQDFLDFVFSAEGRQIREQGGYIPIEKG